MRNLLVCLVLLPVLAAALPAAAQDGATTLSATVIFDTIRLRFGPGTDYPVAGDADQGDILTLNGRNEDGSWYRATLSNNLHVWVAAFLISVEGDAETLPVVPAPETGDYALIVPPGCEYFNVGPLFGAVGQPVFLTQGWEAASEELVRDYLNSVIQVVTFDERIIGTYASYVSDITYNEDRGTWQVFWEFRMGQVSAGAHRIAWTQMFDRPITDGLDNNGDGQPDTYGPDITTYGCTIIISE